MRKKGLLDSHLTSAVFAGALALCVALAAMFFVAAMPTAYLEQFVQALNLPLFLPQAAPPLGLTARCLLAFAGGGTLGSIAWVILYSLDRLLVKREQVDADDEDNFFYAAEDAPAAAMPTPVRPLSAVEEIGQPPEVEEAHFEELDLAPWKIVEERAEPIAAQPEEEEKEEVIPFSFSIANSLATDAEFEPLPIDEAAHEPSFLETEEAAEIARIVAEQQAPQEAPLDALLARLDAGLAKRATVKAQPMRPGGAIQSQLEELKRMAAGR